MLGYAAIILLRYIGVLGCHFGLGHPQHLKYLIYLLQPQFGGGQLCQKVL